MAAFFQTYAVFFKYYTIISYAVIAYQQFVVSDHTKETLYHFICHTDGYYDITYWVPGDWDKPANDVYVTSYAEDNVYSQTLYSQTTVSDRVITNHVYLRKGLNTVRMDIGSGTVLTHNVGHLISVVLNDSVMRTWTINGFPVNVVQKQLGELISPEVGSTKITYIGYQPPSNPLGITDGLPTMYSNPSVMAYIPPNPPATTWLRGPLNGDNSITYYTQPDAIVSCNYNNTIGSFTTTRLPDYRYSITIKCLQSPTE